MRVINAIVFKGNPYNRLLYANPAPRYRMVPGSVADAIGALATESRQILHLHWEEGFLRQCASTAEAEAAAQGLIGSLRSFVGLGGRLVWTIHNELPHELGHAEVFLRLRAGLADLAARITVHSPAATAMLAAQCDLDRRKVAHIPHPSYLGYYEGAAETLAREPDWDSTRLLFLGRLRRYKGLELLIEATRLAGDVAVDIIGEPLRAERYLDEMMPQAAALPGLRIDPRRVLDAELPDLLRGSRGIVLPYRRFLTSGVALLAMTYGRPIIAPDLPQMREILPPSAQRLLFRQGDASSLAERMRQLRDMDRAALGEIRADLQARARADSPARVSEQLFDLFDDLERVG